MTLHSSRMDGATSDMLEEGQEDSSLWVSGNRVELDQLLDNFLYAIAGNP